MAYIDFTTLNIKKRELKALCYSSLILAYILLSYKICQFPDLLHLFYAI